MLLYASCADVGQRPFRLAVEAVVACRHLEGKAAARFYGYDNDDDAVFSVEGDIQEWVLDAARHGLTAVYPIDLLEAEAGAPHADLFVVTGQRVGWKILNEKMR